MMDLLDAFKSRSFLLLLFFFVVVVVVLGFKWLQVLSGFIDF